MRSWLLSLGVSLALTLSFELGFALMCRRRGRALLLIALANVLTNPAVVLAALLWRSYALPAYPAAVAALELCAVLAEGFIYKKSREGFLRPYRFSLAANAVSFGLGVLLGRIL